MLSDDKLHEECGIFGIYAPKGQQAARQVYYGLIALQHRGQESAGISVIDTAEGTSNMLTHKGMGLVSEVFTKDVLNGLKGNLGVGHVRYSTTGGSKPENAQPLAMQYFDGSFALVHNGNIVNCDEHKTAQARRGQAHYTSSDSEVLAYEIINERVKCDSLETAIGNAAKKLKGGYACLIMSGGKITRVTSAIKKADGTTVMSYTATPGTASFDVTTTRGKYGKSLNDTMIFNNLAIGTYTYTVTVTAERDGVTGTYKYSKQFKVQ